MGRNWRERYATLAFTMAVLLGPSTAAYSQGHHSGGGGTPKMGRIRTIGFEIGINDSHLDGAPTTVGATVDTVTFRSGANSVKFDSSAAAAHIISLTIGLAATELPSVPGDMYFRAYVNVASLPTNASAQILGIGSLAGEVRLTSSGTFILTNGAAQIGAASAPINLNQWYRVELNQHLEVGSTDSLELQVDGVSVASGSGLTISDTWASSVALGWITNPGTSSVIYFDDVALNISGGSSQNSWPGSGKIVLLKPVSDNAAAGWTAGAGGATNLFAAVANTPPVGLATGTNTSQIKDLVSSATNNYDANMTDYASAGLTSLSTITLVQAVIDQGQASVTGTKNGAVQVVSNPAQAVEDSFTFGTGATGTWPTGWTGIWGTAQVTPSVALGTSPVLRLGKRTATTSEVDADFMGIYVEYVDSAPIIQASGGIFSPIVTE